MSTRPLVLRRPLVVFDLETTGTDTASDRIVELALVTLRPDGTRDHWSCRVNPGRPIPPAATAVHHITDADVADAPRFQSLARDLLARLSGCDLSNFNLLRYDLPLLCAEFARAGVPFPPAGTQCVDSMSIFHMREQRTLGAALSFYCGREHAGAHGALADAQAAADVLLGQLARYADLPADVAGLHAVCHTPPPGALDIGGKLVWKNGEAVIAFGKKHSNKPLRAVLREDRGYLEWMVNGDFPDDTKAIVREALAGRFPSPPTAAEGNAAAVSLTDVTSGRIPV